MIRRCPHRQPVGVRYAFNALLVSSESFKLLSNPSAAPPPCRSTMGPSTFAAAIFSILSTAVCLARTYFKPNRPFVLVHIANVSCQALYDSGANVSCIHDSVFRSFSPDVRPQAIPSLQLQFHLALGDALQVRGVYSISISLLGKTVQHNFCVIKNLSEQVILGADFINRHALAYCPLTTTTHWATPLFLVKKKDGTFCVVQDFCALNANCYVDKYTMKDVTECINEIGRANSTIFSTFDLTSGFWQMLLHPKSRKFTAFTLPGLGQFEWITSSMGLLGGPSSFQRLVEAVVHGIADVIVYIDDLIVHSSDHDIHLKQLDQLFTRLIAHNLKVKLQKCVFGSNHVQYLGFLLSEYGIRPGTDKLKAVQLAAPPSSVKEVRQFLGLCNFF